MSTLLSTVSGFAMLPPSAQYSTRLSVKSSSSNRTYVIAQNAKTGAWSCSCPASIFQKGPRYNAKPCKHIRALNLVPMQLAA
jgi:hypothetical protein